LSIKNSLTQDGINDSRLDVKAFGEEQPNYANIPLSERRKNRRVIISVDMDL
jgi:outer membrane protein OmpA-like peptidoglycan-associated protein